MVGGTKRPPQDSESGPWPHEQSNGKSNIKNKSNTKTFHERKSQNLSPVEVSLDNADTVIEGGPLLKSQITRGGPPFALFERWDSTVPALLDFRVCCRRAGASPIRANPIRERLFPAIDRKAHVSKSARRGPPAVFLPRTKTIDLILADGRNGPPVGGKCALSLAGADNRVFSWFH